MNIDTYFLILVVLNIILILYIGIGRTENFAASDPTSDPASEPASEAVINVASVYNNNLLQVSNIKTTGDLTVPGKVSFLPKGSIIAYYGQSVPDGWAVCDGNNGTPDLRGRFVVGQGQGAYLTPRTVGQSGGEEMHTLTLDEMPSHSHGVSVTPADDGGYCQHGPCGVQTSDRNIDDDPGVKGITINATGGGRAHNNLPPFYVLYYIMKTV